MSAATFLAYVDAVPGRLYPLVGTLLELAGRGYRVAVRCGIDDVERLRSLGLEARSLRVRSSASRPRTGGQAVATATRAEEPDKQVIAVAPTQLDRSDPEEGDPR